MLGVGAEVAAAGIDSTVSALYDVQVAPGTTVKLNVYRIATLAEQWPTEPTWSTTVTLTSVGEEIRVPIEGADVTIGFYKVEVEK